MENCEWLGWQKWPEIEPGTSHLPVLKCRTAQPLMGPRTDSINIHDLLWIRTGTFDVEVGSPSHCTVWLAYLLMCLNRWISLFFFFFSPSIKPYKMTQKFHPIATAEVWKVKRQYTFQIQHCFPKFIFSCSIQCMCIWNFRHLCYLYSKSLVYFRVANI